MKSTDFSKKSSDNKGTGLFDRMKVKGPTGSQKPKPPGQQSKKLTVDSSKQIQNSEKPKKSTEIQEKNNQDLSNTKVETIDGHEKSQPKKSDEEQNQLSFQMPPLITVKVEKSNQQSKISTASKISSDKSDNDAGPKSPKPRDSWMQEKKAEQMGYKFERKESASQSNFEIQKKRNRKESNPFLNQIKKAPVRNIQNDLEETPKEIIGKQVQSIKIKQKQSVLQLIKAIHMKVIELILKQKQLKESIIQIAGNLQQNREQLANSSQRQLQFIEKEDYDEAENLQNKIENLQKAIEEQQVELNKRQKQFYANVYDQLKHEKQQHLQSKKLIRQLKMVELQLQDDTSNLKRQKATFQESQDAQIQKQNKKIMRLQNDIKFQSEQFEELQRKYKQDLNQMKDPLVEQLAQHQSAKKQIDLQIEELEKRLKQKRESLKETNFKIVQMKKQLQSVEDNFKQEGIKLRDRNKKIEGLQKERKDLSQKVKQIQTTKLNEITKIQIQCSEIQKQIQKIVILSKEIEIKQSTFQQKIEDRKVKADNFIHNTKLLNEFQGKHKERKNFSKQLQFKKANVVAQVNSLQQKRNLSKKKIPKLQNEQKSLVECKNWKGAGMKKTEIKEVQEQIEKLGKKIQDCFVKEKQLQQKIIKFNENQQQYISEQNQIRNNLAISQFKFNICKWEELNEEIKWLKESKDGYSAKDQPKYLQSLSEQATNLTEELQYIGEEYGLNIDFLNQNKTNQKSQALQKQTEKQSIKKVESKEIQRKTQIIRNENKDEETETPAKENNKNYNEAHQQDHLVLNNDEQQQVAEQQVKQEEEEEEEEEVGYVPLQID